MSDPGGRDENSATDLSSEAPFRLGHLLATPAALLVESDGWSRRLEPRAMQVLVVLASLAPRVVGRSELNARVWGGRVVGEDALNRAVQTLRRLALEAPAPPPFGIETIPRVGYRLTEGSGAGGGDERDGHDDADTTVAARRIGRVALLLALIVGAVALIVSLVQRRPASAAWAVASATTLDDLPAGASDAVPSPDGQRLAYRARDPAGRERVFVRETLDGGTGSPVTPPDMDAHLPAWSPDGSRIAFSSYDPGRPCQLYVVRRGERLSRVGLCETARDPQLAWSSDGRALLFGDAPGWNAVPRITRLGLDDGQRAVLSSPPGDSMGDDRPIALGDTIVFQRQYAWADEGWVARDPSGAERVLWRRAGVAGTAATALPDGTLVIAWTRAGASGLDFVGRSGRVRSRSATLGPVTAVAAAGTSRLLIETDQRESSLVRAGDGAAPARSLVTVRGRILGAVPLGDGSIRFPATAAGLSRIWQRGADGSLRPWGSFTAVRIAGLALSPDGTRTAALMTGDAGREIVVFDALGRLVHRWNPHARSVNPAAWDASGRRLIVPVLDGAGWRLFAIDPATGAPPRDIGLPGYAVLLGRGAALYAVRAGETMGQRELWRIDGGARRLPIDLTLYDIVNWWPVDQGLWLPDRSDRDRPMLVLRDAASGRVLRRVPAPDLGPAGTGLAADARGPLYVTVTREAPSYALLTLSGGER